ncbi:MAG: hypothetical protein WCD80_05330 [Desulfobaccales bacterium]
MSKSYDIINLLLSVGLGFLSIFIGMFISFIPNLLFAGLYQIIMKIKPLGEVRDLAIAETDEIRRMEIMAYYYRHLTNSTYIIRFSAGLTIGLLHSIMYKYGLNIYILVAIFFIFLIFMADKKVWIGQDYTLYELSAINPNILIKLKFANLLGYISIFYLLEMI